MDALRIALPLALVALAPTIAGAELGEPPVVEPASAEPADAAPEPTEVREQRILQALSSPPARALSALPPIGTEVELLLTDGQRLRGRYAGPAAGGLYLEVGGLRIAVPRALIQKMGPPDRAVAPALRDSNRTRYLYSPSGFLLKKGEGYLSQTELLLSTVAFGVTDWLTVQAGTVLPILAYSPEYTPAVLAVKVGGSPAERIHVAGGFQSLLLPTDSEPILVGLLFGTFTWGTEDLHFGLSVGPPWVLSGAEKDMGRVLVSLSANWRAFRHGALVTENWLYRGDGATHVVGSLAYRFLSERVAVDIGLVLSDFSGVPVPWLDFTWHWGQ